MTVNYIENSLRLYRRTRLRVCELLSEVRQAGYEQVHIQGEGDIADICKLTCLEQGFHISEQENSLTNSIPTLEVRGMKVMLHMEKKYHGI